MKNGMRNKERMRVKERKISGNLGVGKRVRKNSEAEVI